jgi:pimeloyl-ACP methyl ester carboxylesterase
MKIIICLTNILFLFISISKLAHSADLSFCSGLNIHVLTLPIFPERFNSETFEYHYLIKQKSNDPKVPTIIFLPGGPGGTSINMGFMTEGETGLPFDFLELAFGLPKNYNVILTDPRGRGCNFDSNKPLSHDAFRTHYLASDVLAMISKLNLKNYILLGHSYGTTLATEIASRAGKGEAPPPKAVVLAGVVGKYFEPLEQDNAFQNEWILVRNSLPIKLRDQFPATLSEFTNKKLYPLGLRGELWLNYIKNYLTQGVALLAGKPILPTLNDRLKIILSKNLNNITLLKDDVSENESQIEGLDTEPIFVQIACRELFNSEDECKRRNIPTDSLYDSKYWQINSPIYYIEGENDPNTPMAQAKYHFFNQNNPNKYFISVPRAGHGVLTSINECKDFFWKSVYSEGVNLENALKNCSVGPKLLRP